MLELSKHSKALAIEVNSTRKTKSDNFNIIIDGKRNLFNITEIPVENSGSVGFAFDITSKEKIKQELDRYISAQSDLLESSSSAMAIYSADTRIRYFNQAFMKLWNLDEKYLATHPTYGEILEELREKRKLPEQSNFPAFKQKHLKLFTNLIDPYNEFFYLPDGTALRVLIIPHALGGLLFAYEDMTNHLALERSYNTSIAVQKTTLDNLHEGIAVFGANGRLKLSNPIFAKLWNFSQEFLDTEPHINEITDKIKSYFNEDNWNEVKENLFIALVKRDRSKLIMERNDGTVIKRISLPLPDGALLITHLDITDSMRVERSLRERNEALQEADKTKTEFLANISYEFRSPLTSIMGLSEVLDKLYFGELNEKQKEYVVGIYKSSQYLMSLVNDILDLASIEAGYMKLELSRFDIYQSINSLIPLFKERIKEANINFKFNCVPYFGLVIADEKRIKQVVFKLISNSIKFNKNGGNIILSVKEVEGTKISISVEDTGVGIDKEEQERVFNKFYKISSNKIGKSGAGLGLSVVKSFIELHYGTVHIESNEDNVSGTKIICIFDRENKILSEIVDKENKLLEFA
jgi:signal transduction histidine kinase